VRVVVVVAAADERGVTGAELAEPDRRGAGPGRELAPVAGQQRVEPGRVGVDVGGVVLLVVVGRVDELVLVAGRHGDGGRDGPAEVEGVRDALDHDQQVGVRGQNCISRTLGRQVPVGGRIAVTPRGGTMRFVAEVSTDHHVINGVSRGHRGPVA